MEFQSAGNVKRTLDILEGWLAPFISDSKELDNEKVLVWSQIDIRCSLLREVWNELEVGHMAASSSEQLQETNQMTLLCGTKVPNTIQVVEI